MALGDESQAGGELSSDGSNGAASSFRSSSWDSMVGAISCAGEDSAISFGSVYPVREGLNIRKRLIAEGYIKRRLFISKMKRHYCLKRWR